MEKINVKNEYIVEKDIILFKKGENITDEDIRNKIRKLMYDDYLVKIGELIPIPFNIIIHNYNNILYLINNDEALCCIDGKKNIIPKKDGYFNSKKFYLQSCKREDLKCGDIIFCCANINFIDVNEPHEYGVIKNEERYVCWDNNNVIEWGINWKYFFKVVER